MPCLACLLLLSRVQEWVQINELIHLRGPKGRKGARERGSEGTSEGGSALTSHKAAAALLLRTMWVPGINVMLWRLLEPTFCFLFGEGPARDSRLCKHTSG